MTRNSKNGLYLHKLRALFCIPFVFALFLSVALPTVVNASGQMLSDQTGFVQRLDVEAGGHTFEIETVSNFDILNHSFDGDQRRLTLYVSSSIEENLGELIIPLDLLGGDYAFYLDDTEFHPGIRSNDKIAFVTMNFTGTGDHKIDIVADTYLGESYSSVDNSDTAGGGCLIATVAYGSELAPGVQILREVRDMVIKDTKYGGALLSEFHRVYYVFSPGAADYLRENPFLADVTRLAITPLVTLLGIVSLAESEQDVLAYGALALILNAGLYVAAPAMALVYMGRRMSIR